MTNLWSGSGTAPGPLTRSVELVNVFDSEPSVRFYRLPSEAGTLRLRPAISEPHREQWEEQDVRSAWPAADVLASAEWFMRHTAPQEPVSTEAVWFGSPAVGFRVIHRNPEGLSLDVCWAHHPDVLLPTLTGEAAEPSGDDRYTYLTIDMRHETIRAAAATWSIWAAGALNE